MLRPSLLAAALSALLAGAACAADADEDATLATLENDPVLSRELAGTSNRRVTDREGGEQPLLTVLMDVTGDWNAVSVRLAEAARATGWTVTAVNCVGTGNDVIAKKRIGGEWFLLESGAGTRGAGIILRYDPQQQAPEGFSASGRCPPELVRAAETP